ncbi:MAG: sulfotransferase domain-containing protein [Deltaproteobacteria bacterium]|nr:sulfotransferase domain-containing protein [Deltaproteobacteria bacterium]
MKRRRYVSVVDDNARWDGFAPRSGDVFVCTPAKCGTTWMQSIVASLLWPTGDAPGPVLAISPWIEMKGVVPLDELHAMLAAQTHRRFMKTHTPADGIPWFDEARYIFVARDGRDAFMSLCNHVEKFQDHLRDALNADAAAEGLPAFPAWTGDVHGFFARWLELDDFFFRHLATYWEARHRPNLLLVHYNDLKTDLAGEMRRIAAFLGTDVPEARWPEVVDRCTFERMREGETRMGAVDMVFKGGLKSFVFKGTNGRWRDVLTADELAAYARRVAGTLPPDCAAWMERGRSALARP